METLLRKYLWALDCAVIIVVAFFCARATAVMIESALIRRISPPKRVARSSTGGAAQTVYAKDVDDILKRNIFCSTCPPLVEKATTAAGPPKAVEPQKTSLPLNLMAIMFSPPPSDPRWSVAIIRDTEEKSVGPYAIGESVHNARIVDIQETRIYLDNAGRPEFLDLIDQPVVAAAAPVVAPPTDPFAAELERGIKKTGENSYEIQRSTVDSLLGNMGALARGARIVPEVKDGKSAGFRLFSIRPDGPFGRIGLQNGDVIVAINGLEMTSPDKALEVYTKLRTASHLSVSLERNSQKITKDYNIR